MKAEDIAWLKEYEASERGVSPSEISDSEAVASYRRRRRITFAGLILTLFLYLCLRGLLGTLAGRIFVTVVILVSISLCLSRLRWPTPLKPGQKLAIKKELSGYLSANIGQVTDELAQQFHQWDWRYLTSGLAFAAVATLIFDWIRPNIALEIVDLLIFYYAARFAGRLPRMKERTTNR